MFWYVFKRGGGLAAFLALMGCVALFVALFPNNFSEARIIDGTVTQLEKNEARSANGTANTTFYVTVTMPGARHREAVSGRFFNELVEGQIIPVKVVDTTPVKYLLDEQNNFWSWIAASALAALCLAAALLLGRLGWKTGRQEWRLRTHGVETRAEIMGANKDMIPKIRVSYTANDGLPREIDRPSPANVEIGQITTVIYDPEHPEVAMLATELGLVKTA